ncbi:uncharacterized protein V6R79_014357 [Siganus canaliculatus]
MSVNSSSSSLYHCSEVKVLLVISSAYNVVKLLVLSPLSILVLHVGLQRWRQQRSFASTSHSDVFTYHTVAMELISALGIVIYSCGMYTEVMVLIELGLYPSAMVYPGQVCFHILTSVERYLAVVHPVTYLQLRQSRGVKIRNFSIACVWLLCLGWIIPIALSRPHVPTKWFFCLLTVSIVVMCFCSIRILCVLVRPRPGDVGGDGDQVDQSKQRAFHTVVSIMAVLSLWFAGNLTSLALDTSELLSNDVSCMLLAVSNILSLPSSCILPLLFLHRAGKRLCCLSP